MISLAGDMELENKSISENYNVEEMSETQEQMLLPTIPQHLPMATSVSSLQQQQQQPLQQQASETTTTTPERGHLCTTCLKGFRSKQQLNQHSLVHSGIRKHDCSYCDKSFKQLSHLQQHIRIHTGEKPYKCAIDGCDRAFAQLSNLHHHLRNHDDQVKKAETRLYKCAICNRSYTNDSSLKSHTLKMHIHIKPIDIGDINCGVRPHKEKQKFYGNSKLQSNSDGMESMLLPQILGLQKTNALHLMSQSGSGDRSGIVRVPTVNGCQKIIREECIELDENGDIINITVDHRKLAPTEAMHDIMSDRHIADGRNLTDRRSMTDGHNMTDGCSLTDRHNMTDGRYKSDGHNMSDGRTITDGRNMTDGRSMTDGRNMTDKQLHLNVECSPGSNSVHSSMLSPVSPHETHMSQIHHHGVQLSPDKNLGHRSHQNSGAMSPSSGIPVSDGLPISSQNSRFSFLDQHGVPESFSMMNNSLRRNPFPLSLSRTSPGMEHLPLQVSSSNRALDSHNFYGTPLSRLPLTTPMPLTSPSPRMTESRTFTTLGN